MKWQELLTTYWSQVVLVLLAISYFVKRILDIRSKKIEITYSLFQQNKINTVNLFFSNYAKVESMWHKLSYWEAIEYKMKSKELDEIIWPPINDLKQSVLELKMYFENPDLVHFKKLLGNILSINDNLLTNRHDSSDKPLINKVNNFVFYQEKVLAENNKIIDILTSTIRNSFNQK